jgi:hypothetical protein
MNIAGLNGAAKAGQTPYHIFEGFPAFPFLNTAVQ